MAAHPRPLLLLLPRPVLRSTHPAACLRHRPAANSSAPNKHAHTALHHPASCPAERARRVGASRQRRPHGGVCRAALPVPRLGAPPVRQARTAATGWGRAERLRVGGWVNTKSPCLPACPPARLPDQATRLPPRLPASSACLQAAQPLHTDAHLPRAAPAAPARATHQVGALSAAAWQPATQRRTTLLPLVPPPHAAEAHASGQPTPCPGPAAGCPGCACLGVHSCVCARCSTSCAPLPHRPLAPPLLLAAPAGRSMGGAPRRAFPATSRLIMPPTSTLPRCLPLCVLHCLAASALPSCVFVCAALFGPGSRGRGTWRCPGGAGVAF